MVTALRRLRLIASVLVVLIVTTNGFARQGDSTSFPGKKTDWNGFDRFDFEIDSHQCIVVTPRETATGKPWIWRARFFGHEPQADIALLYRGFHLVYCDVANLFGSPQAVARWDKFYAYLTEEHGFAPKAALEGMSRGGLIIYNWAAANPEKVACIYADAPVCDFKSWPGGKGKGKGSGADWRVCREAYGFTEEQALAFKGNPIDNLQPLAKAKIPLLHVVGDADDVVPVAENTAIIAERYRKLGGSITVINKRGVGHHPHSLKDPTPIVEFVLQHSR
jgi:pimeloyl-ACP methyl ester carboxylesterase